MRSTLFISGLVGLVGCVASACFVHTNDPPHSRTWTTSGTTQSPRTSSPNTGTAPPATTRNDRVAPIRSDARLVVSEEIRDKCRLATAREDQPLFEPGSSEIKGKANEILEGLALCLATGPLKDRRIRIEGHTDPRGGEEYNRELGQKRADATKAYLASRGISNERMNAVSIGLTESKGTDEATWTYDRRVEIELVPENVMIRRR